MTISRPSPSSRRAADSADRADVVVIGAGMGGLSAAVSLAARGLSVRVLEMGPRPGGKVGVETVDGVEFDTGPSVLTLPDALDRVLRLAGTSLRGEVELVKPEPAFRYLFPGGDAVDVHVDPERTLVEVRGALGARAADELAGFLAYAGRIWEASAPHFVLGDAPSAGALLRGGPASLALLPRIDPLRSMESAIRRRVRDERLRWILLRYATYVGSDPRRAPATLNCIAHVELALGGYGVRGGMYEVARALVRTVERLGGRVECGVRVARVDVRDGVVRGVETEDGRRIDAGAVVCNAEPAHLFADLLPPDARSRRTEPAEPSTSGWTAVLRARRAASGGERRVAHTVVFPGRYAEEFADLFDRGRPPDDPTVYLCAQEAAHARTGWEDDEPVFFMANAPAEPPGRRTPDEVWAALRARVLARLDAAALRRPGDAVVWERTPRGLADRFPRSRGAIYGAASNSRLAAFRRLPNRIAGAGPVYLASGGAHPGGGVPLCLLSGLAAARALLADRGLAASTDR